MNIALWSASILLAGIFLGSGVAKSVLGRERLLASGQTGIAPFPMPLVRVVAVLEIVGAVGLIVPWAFETAHVLTPLAAVGLAVFMYGAAIAHASLREPKSVAINLTLFALCGFVIAGRVAQLVGVGG